jgi:hypothetical protein
MSEIPRFTIEELQVRYDLEPSLNDIYVEGIFDKEIIDRLHSTADKPYRAIYEIDAVNVPPELVKSYKLTDGNKQRVLTLARELAKIVDQCHYKCLVDRDLDHWFGSLEDTKNLAWTDHTSIELYYLSEEFVRDITVVTAKCKITNWLKFYESFITVLRSLYAMRLADRSLALSMNWLSADRSLSALGSQIVFDRDGYINKLLIANKKSSQFKEYHALFNQWENKLTNDPRSHIRGHDLISMISWTIKSFKGLKEYASEAAIERIFVLLADRAKEVVKVLN